MEIKSRVGKKGAQQSWLGNQPRLIFAVDDIEALCAHFQHAGVEIIAGGSGKRWVMVRDADGNEVVFET